MAQSLPARDWVFAGFDLTVLGLGLAFAMTRHATQVWRQAPHRAVIHACRMAGIACLAGAFAACIARWGWAVGPTAWFGVLATTALGLVCLLSYIPRLAACAAALAIAATIVAALLPA